MASYTINNKQFTQKKLSIFKIPALVTLMKSVPANITTTDAAMDAFSQVFPEAIKLIFPQITAEDMEDIDLETGAQIVEDFLTLNNVDAVITKFTDLFTKLKSVLDKIKVLFG